MTREVERSAPVTGTVFGAHFPPTSMALLAIEDRVLEGAMWLERARRTAGRKKAAPPPLHGCAKETPTAPPLSKDPV